jgi:hypothetical protein
MGEKSNQTLGLILALQENRQLLGALSPEHILQTLSLSRPRSEERPGANWRLALARSTPKCFQNSSANRGDLVASRAHGTRQPHRLPPLKGALWPLPQP